MGRGQGRRIGSGEQEKDQYLGGWIGAAFFLVGAPAAILMGYVGGSHNRCTLFFWVVILGAPSWQPVPASLSQAACPCSHTSCCLLL